MKSRNYQGIIPGLTNQPASEPASQPAGQPNHNINMTHCGVRATHYFGPLMNPMLSCDRMLTPNASAAAHGRRPPPQGMTVHLAEHPQLQHCDRPVEHHPTQQANAEQQQKGVCVEVLCSGLSTMP